MNFNRNNFFKDYIKMYLLLFVYILVKESKHDYIIIQLCYAYSAEYATFHVHLFMLYTIFKDFFDNIIIVMRYLSQRFVHVLTI